MSSRSNTSQYSAFFSKAITAIMLLMLLFSPYQYVMGQEVSFEAEPAGGEIATTTEVNGPINIDMLQEALGDHSQSEIADILQKTYELNDKQRGEIADARTESDLLDAINLALGGEEVSSGGPEVQSLTASGGGAIDPVVSSLVNGTDASQRLRVDANQHTGAAGYNYPFDVPQWIGGLNPGVSVSYSSERQLNDSIVGYGWELSLPYIQRRNITGLDTIYTSDDYMSSLHGNLKEVLPNVYQAQYDDGSFATYTKSGNTWTLTTKSGYEITFGTTAASRKDNAANTAEVFTWYIDSIEDRNDNTITYTYFKNDGQVYPATITYGLYSVQFNRQSRNDDLVSYTPGFYTKTNYRIHEIITKFNGTTIRKYDLNYTVGDNDNRSLLESVQETAYNGGTTTTLPATTFTYSEHSRQWVGSADNYTIGGSSSFNFMGIQNSVPVDLNGDSWVDWVRSSKDALSANPIINENVGIHNTLNTVVPQYTGGPMLPTGIYVGGGSWLYCSLNIGGAGSVFTDLNGDRQYDLLESQNYSTYACNGYYGNFDTYTGYLGQTAGAWVNAPAYDSDINFLYSLYSRFVRDLNVDGLPDTLQINSNVATVPSGATSVPQTVETNNGTGFDPVNTTDWKIPVHYDDWGNPYLTTGYNSNIGDYNGDGTVDVLTAVFDPLNGTGQSTKPLYFGDGRGNWTQDTAVTTWGDFKVGAGSGGGTKYFVPQLDINGDGLIDFYSSVGVSWAGPQGVFMNTGEDFNEFHPDYTLSSLSAIATGSSNNHPYVDINADGLIDYMLQSGNAGEVNAKIAQGMVPDHLISINHSTGATTDITYKPSTHYKDTSGNLLNPDLPMIVQTAHQITTNDNNGVVSTATYEYADGHYYYQDAQDRRFAGFGKVTATDALGQDNVTYYHQGNGQQGSEPNDPADGSLIGKIWKTERATNTGVIIATSDTTWASTSLGNDRYFVRPTQSVANEDGKITTTTRLYNTSTGNLDTETVSFNDGQSYTTTTTDYTYTSGSLVLPATATVSNGGTDWQRVRMYYDGQTTLGLTNADGNLTKQSVWDGSQWIDTNYTYDAFGNVLTETNPENNTTTYTYDSYDLFPATITNDLNHTTSFSYDYAVGQPITITDPNGDITSMTYDGLGRTLSTRRNNLLLESHQYVDVANPYVNTTTHFDTANYVGTTYMDGLGRVIHTVKDIAFFTQDSQHTIYDQLGRVSQQSLPYWDGPVNGVAPSNWITTTYDALDRPKTITDVTGTINYFYNTWSTTVNDKNSVNKTLSYNGQGNLIQVIEYNAGAQYATSYTYNPNGNLIQLIDAENNVRTFGYDLLGRRLTATDGGTGTHTYTYDNNGNVLTWTTPANDTITYTYDDLDRILTEISGADTVTYTYDQGPNALGQLTSTTSQGITTAYTFDGMGYLSSEARTVNGTTYTTTYTNDRHSRATDISYPDGNVITYTYYNENLINTITLNGTTALVSQTLYMPNRQVTGQYLPTVGLITYTYDSNQLYRLTNKTTPGIQDISYTYDNNGNVLTINDQSTGGIAKLSTFTYDDLNRLTSATITNSANNQDYTYNYSYSPTGNILTAGNDTYSYNAAHPQAVSDINGINYSYDANGNVIGIDSDSFAYNYKNQLTSSTVTTGGGSSTPDVIRTTTYVIDDAIFTGTDYTLILDQDLSSNYFAIVNGGSDDPNNRSPREDGVRVSGDPFGNFATTTSANGLQLDRQNSANDWRGTITVVECLADCTTDGFELSEVGEVTLAQGSQNTLQTTTHTFTNPHQTNTVIIDGGQTTNGNGAAHYGATFGTRITKSGSNDVTLERFGAQNRLPRAGFQTLYQVNLGSAWTTEEVTIDAWTSHQDGVAIPTAYTSTTLGQSYDTDKTFALTTSYSERDGIGEGSTSIVTTFGEGTSPVPSTTNQISVASEYAGTRYSTITILSHPDLFVQHVFKADGDTGNNQGWQTLTLTLPQTLTSDNVMTTMTNTSRGVGNSYSRTGSWSSYLSDPSTITYERPFSGQMFAAWFQAIDFTSFLGTTSGGGSSSTTSYTYDHSGQRVTKDNGTNTTIYANKLFHTDGTTNTASVYSGAMQIATIKGGTLTYNLSDHLNSSSLTIDDQGNVLQSLDYFPFGSERINSGSFEADKTYTNHYSDTETGLLYMGARYYGGDMRRFMSQDPASLYGPETFLQDPQQLNLYTYARNNPLAYVDPNGESILGAAVLGGIVLVETAKALAVAGVVIIGTLGVAHVLDNSPPVDIQSPFQFIPETVESGIYIESTYGWEDSLGDILEGAEPIGKSPRNPDYGANKWQKNGTAEDVFDDFFKLGPQNVRHEGEVTIGDLDGGGTVVARPSTKDGRATLEVQPKDGVNPDTKIRYEPESTSE
ncbi:MAG: RHS repeat-associated core domain-containing protein [Bacteroidota bacterium]